MSMPTTLRVALHRDTQLSQATLILSS
jgi:hypothetical protein